MQQWRRIALSQCNNETTLKMQEIPKNGTELEKGSRIKYQDGLK